MKILYVTTIGATMSFFEKFIGELVEQGHIVDIATNDSERKVPDCYAEYGCKVFTLKCSRSPLRKGNLDAITQIKDIIKKGNYDMGIFPLSPEELTPYSVLREINTPPCSYSSAELEKYITATYADNEKNAKAYAKAEQIIASQGVFVPLYYASTQIYCNEGVTGFYTSPDGAMVYFHQGARSSQ